MTNVGLHFGVRKTHCDIGQMQRFLGYLLIAIAVAGALTQQLLGLNLFVDEAGRYFLGPNNSGAFNSPVGEAVVYLVFYFIGMLGLALMATSKRNA